MLEENGGMMRSDGRGCAVLLLLGTLLPALLAGCAEGAPPPRLPTGPWQQLNNWDGQRDVAADPGRAAEPAEVTMPDTITSEAGGRTPSERRTSRPITARG